MEEKINPRTKQFKQVFEEHCCIVNDLDSLSRFPFYCLVNKKKPKDLIHLYVKDLAMKDPTVALLLGGNGGEADYNCLTGRVVEEDVTVTQYNWIHPVHGPCVRTERVIDQYETSKRHPDYDEDKLTKME